MKAVVETYVGNSLRNVDHPSYQAYSYSKIIENYNSSIQDKNVKLHPCSYLHNFREKNRINIDNEFYRDILIESPIFLQRDARNLSKFISKYIKKTDNGELLYYIENGKIRPSKSLQETITSLIEGNEEFILLGNQKVSYETVRTTVEDAIHSGKKYTIIIEGGPGTGKSVIAVMLLAELTRQGLAVNYVSKNAAPRNVYANKLIGKNLRKKYVEGLFRSSGGYYDIPMDTFDCLIADEAHRLQEKSGMYKNLGEEQTREIIRAAKVSVFFIDEDQIVTMSDACTIDKIIKTAKEEKSEVIYNESLYLESQFRCNGSDGYLAFLDDVLEIRKTSNYDINDLNYEFKIIDDSIELKNLIFEKNKINNKSRLVAGYCWDWVKENANNSNYHDIVIGDFSMSWNLRNTDTYAIDEKSVNEVGCIHTVQGLEFDYIGVIIGLDMIYRDEKIVTDFTKRARTDQSIKGLKGMYKQNPDKALKIADRIIKNTYRTLMTRGMKGCYVYCCDSKLAEYLKQFQSK